MKPPFVRIRGVHTDVSDRFKALCRSRRKRIKRTCVVLFRVYVQAPEKFDVPAKQHGRGNDGEDFVLGAFPAADWLTFKATCTRRHEALPDVTEALMMAYMHDPALYEPVKKYQRRRPRRKPKGLVWP